MPNKVGSFSVMPKSGYCLDFGWRDLREGWVRSEKEGVQWFYLGPMKEEDVPALLAKFGLDVLPAERIPPFDQLRLMSPAELVVLRRTWESEQGLSPLEVTSDLNRRDLIRAEDVRGVAVS